MTTQPQLVLNLYRLLPLRKDEAEPGLVSAYFWYGDGGVGKSCPGHSHPNWVINESLSQGMPATFMHGFVVTPETCSECGIHRVFISGNPEFLAHLLAKYGEEELS